EGQAHTRAREAAPWIEPLGRLGYATCGLVYGLVGVLALEAAIGTGGGTTDTHGALLEILKAPFGQVLLAVVAVGLAGYAVWRLIQGLLDLEPRSRGAKEVLFRLGAFAAFLTYAGLALSAAQVVMGASDAGGGDQQMQDQTAWLMSQP